MNADHSVFSRVIRLENVSTSCSCLYKTKQVTRSWAPINIILSWQKHNTDDPQVTCIHLTFTHRCYSMTFKAPMDVNCVICHPEKQVFIFYHLIPWLCSMECVVLSIKLKPFTVSIPLFYISNVMQLFLLFRLS